MLVGDTQLLTSWLRPCKNFRVKCVLRLTEDIWVLPVLLKIIFIGYGTCSQWKKTSCVSVFAPSPAGKQTLAQFHCLGRSRRAWVAPLISLLVGRLCLGLDARFHRCSWGVFSTAVRFAHDLNGFTIEIGMGWTG